MRSPRPALVLLLILAGAIMVIFASACSGIASPEGWASPVLAESSQGDELLLVAHRDRLLALEAATLDLQWRFPVDGENDEDIDAVALYGTPAALGDDLILIPGYDGTLYGVEHDTGELRWEFETGDAIIGGVISSGNLAYFGSADGNVYAVDSRGALAWDRPFKTDEPIWSTPTVAGGTLYVTSLDHRLYALDPETGEERWSFSTEAGVAATPVVNEGAGLVYVGGFDSRLRAIDIDTGQQAWAIEADNWFWTTPLLDGGTLYAGSLDAHVYAVDALTGQARWARPFTAEAPIRSAPVLAGDALLIIDREGTLYGLDPDEGTELEGSPLELGDDVLADPLLLPEAGTSADGGPVVAVVTTDGELLQIDPTSLQIADRVRLNED